MNHSEKAILTTGPHNSNSISSNCADTPIKPEPVQERRINQQLVRETNKIDNSPGSSVSKEVEQTLSHCAFSNNISRSYMDKMKREDDARSVLAERDVRRVAKQKVQDKSRNLDSASPTKPAPKQDPIVEPKVERKVNQTPAGTTSQKLDAAVPVKPEKSREEVIAERELKKQAKLAKKTKTTDVVPPAAIGTLATTEVITKKLETVTIAEKPVLSKAERREKQEAQRAAKAKLVADKEKKKPVQSMENKPKPAKVEKASEISVRKI